MARCGGKDRQTYLDRDMVRELMLLVILVIGGLLVDRLEA